jgi:ABC-2 type transport system ATP-binding protein
MTGPAIEMRHLSKRFPSGYGLVDLSLTVARGAVFGYLGPNGAGKTTTLRMLLGLLRPDAGEVRVLGLNPITHGQQVRAQVGVLLAYDGLYERLSALCNLTYYGRMYHVDPAVLNRRQQALLETFGLWSRRHERVVTWSTGMRKKLAIARSLLHAPRLLLLDEPFAGLDPEAAVDLRQRIVRLAREEDLTVMMTTHELAHVEKTCTDVAILEHGRLLAYGTPAQMRHRHTAIEVHVAGRGLTYEMLTQMRQEGWLTAFRLKGAAARLSCDAMTRQRLGHEFSSRGVCLEELYDVRPSLEDAFLSILADAYRSNNNA